LSAIDWEVFISKGKDKIVYRRPEDNKWVNKRLDREQASSVHDKHVDAEARAGEMLKKSGGGELITKGRDGRIRSKHTIQPGNDPNPAKDTEHSRQRTEHGTIPGPMLTRGMGRDCA